MKNRGVKTAKKSMNSNAKKKSKITKSKTKNNASKSKAMIVKTSKRFVQHIAMTSKDNYECLVCGGVLFRFQTRRIMESMCALFCLVSWEVLLFFDNIAFVCDICLS